MAGHVVSGVQFLHVEKNPLWFQM